MKDIILKSTLLTILTVFLAVPAAADWMTDPAVETMWSSGITLNNVDLGTSFLTSVLDPIPFGSNWAHGYDRVSTVKAVASMIRPYYIYHNVYDDYSGICFWNFADEDFIMLPRGLQYTLVHEVIDGQGNVLCHDEAPVTIGEGDPLPPVWSGDFDVDNVSVASGQNILLKPTDPITYSVKWAYNAQDFSRKIDLTAISQGEIIGSGVFSIRISSAGDTFPIYNSGTEEEGTCQWDYESKDPSVLPRGDTYTLNYSIYDSDSPSTIFQSENGVTTFTITPEPSLAFLALMAIGLSFRKLI